MQDSETEEDDSEVVEREDALYSSPNGLPITTHGRGVIHDRIWQTAKAVSLDFSDLEKRVLTMIGPSGQGDQQGAGMGFSGA